MDMSPAEGQKASLKNLAKRPAKRPAFLTLPPTAGQEAPLQVSTTGTNDAAGLPTFLEASVF